MGCCCWFFFFTLVTGPTRSLSLKLSETRGYEPQIRARLGTPQTPKLKAHTRAQVTTRILTVDLLQDKIEPASEPLLENVAHFPEMFVRVRVASSSSSSRLLSLQVLEGPCALS